MRAPNPTQPCTPDQPYHPPTCTAHPHLPSAHLPTLTTHAQVYQEKLLQEGVVPKEQVGLSRAGQGQGRGVPPPGRLLPAGGH